MHTNRFEGEPTSSPSLIKILREIHAPLKPPFCCLLVNGILLVEEKQKQCGFLQKNLSICAGIMVFLNIILFSLLLYFHAYQPRQLAVGCK